jgi:LuxR family maltose regulon positive regulatory protein
MQLSSDDPPLQDGHTQTDVLLTSRFRPRRVRGRRVERPRLLARLDEAANHPLTLVTAPAGFGKSTLLAQWAEVSELPVTWVSLTASENDPRLMAAYLTAAMRAAGVPAPGLDDVDNGRRAVGPDTVMSDLLGALAGMTTPIVVVLDDAHLIESDAALDVVEALIDHAPDSVRLIISCRSLPPRVSACLAQDERLLRIGSNDLRFTLDESHSFLGMVGLHLQFDDAFVLHERINGWIAGLQMFALTLSESEKSAAEMLGGFDATNPLLHDFLLQEVLDKQTPEMQAFLLRSALFRRVSIDLCRGALGASQPVSDLLDRVIQDDLFVAPDDGEDGWFAYEPLFHDFLFQRAAAVLSERERTVLYRRAAYWCEQAGLMQEAIDYALAGEDWPHAAMMFVPAVTAMFGREEIATALVWIDALPTNLFASDAELAVTAAWARIRAGVLTDVPRLLAKAQQLYGKTGDTLGLANVSCAYAERARYKAKGETTIQFARQAQELLAQHERQASTMSPSTLRSTIEPVVLRRNIEALTRIQIGTGLFRLGRANDAADELQAAHAYAVAHNTPVYEATAMLQLGHVRVLQGRLDDAIDCYQAIPTSPDSYIVSRRIALTGLSGILRERHLFEHAQQLLDECQEIIDNSPIGFGLWNLLLSRARLAWAQGEDSQALEYAELAARRTGGVGLTWHASMAESFAVRIRLSHGDIGTALEWAHGHRLAPDEPPNFERLHEHLVFARMLVAQGTPEEAIGLLTRSLDAAEEDGRIGDAIEIGVLLAVAYQDAGDLSQATGALGGALRHGERLGYLRVFTDNRLPMVHLLQLVQGSGVTPSYCQRILDTIGEPEEPVAIDNPGTLDESISPRELLVLRLVDRGQSNLEIATSLGISGFTVQRHIESVRGKLGVWTHAEALHKARALGLLSASDAALRSDTSSPGTGENDDRTLASAT